MGETEEERTSQAGQLFENFIQATTCKGTLQAFSVLCRQLELNPSDHRGFYSSLKTAVTFWKAKGLWGKLDKRAGHKEYSKGRACADTRCLIIGGGPCGFRTAIELALLGAKVVVIEKRDTFSRNNVLHLWPYTIHDLRNLGAKKFYGKFCAGSIDHISIRQLQLMLLKIALIVGVEVHVNVEFVKLLEPPEDQSTDGQGWRAEIRPADNPVSDYEFDVIIGADGRRSTLDGFRRKEFRGKLAIAITANFVNRNTTAEAKVEEISGVAFIFNQKFFLELKEETGIDLENIVYYKDNTHYFVMTAKKQSLLDKGVIINDYIETERLLAFDNVNQEALLSYAREAADFGTNYQLPSLDYAINHYGQPDVAMFDFTCMYASENAALVREKSHRQLLVALVGDSLLEPFWPMGTGCARGFLAAFDTAWMIKGWAQGKEPLDLLSERESIYRLLPQTTAENISKNFEQYTIDPATRYPNLNSSCVRPHQVRHLFISGEQDLSSLERSGQTRRSVSISRRESEVRPGRLLLWCQNQTQDYRGVNVTDLNTSWRSGLALCALIHRQRPELIDFDSLNEADCAKNNQLAFDVAEREFGIQPVTTGKEMDAERGPDKLIMVLYLSKFYEMFHKSTQSVTGLPKEIDANNGDCSSKTANSLYNSINHARKRIPKLDKKLEESDVNRKRKKASSHHEELMSCQTAPPAGEREEQKENKVRSMATQLLARFEENAPSCALRRQVSVRKEFSASLGGSDTCVFCQKRVYIMERLSAEGFFFHRECFRCHICGCSLRLGAHTFDSQQGTFYCKMHFSQRKTSTRHRRGEIQDGGIRSSSITISNHTSTDGTRGQPSGGEFDSSTQQDLQTLPDSKEIISVSEVKDSSKKADPADSAPACPDSPLQKVKRSTAKGEITNKNILWKKKIRSTLPLVLMKKFHRGKPEDKTEVLAEEDGNSDFEEIHESLSSKKPSNPSTDSNCLPTKDNSSTPLDEIPKIPLYRTHVLPEYPKPSSSSPEPIVTSISSDPISFSPKKKLTLSLSEKEKLLNWDLTNPGKSGAEEQQQQHVKPSISLQHDHPEPTHPQPEPAPPLFGFQQWANNLRKSFSKGSNPVVLRRNRPMKARPLSEGSFNVGAVFQDEERCGSLVDEGEARPRTESEIASLLEQVALGSKTSRGTKDDMASLPPRKLNFFSSLRIKRVEGAEQSRGEGQKDILSILSRFRNKASAQQQQQQKSNSSSEDEQEPKLTHSGALQKKKEKIAIRQTKSDELKRLHRAQVIQRQLEEVEEKQRSLEEKGVALEKVLRGENGDDGSTDEAALLQTWFKLVLEKNKLSRYESELMIFAQELELEDTQSRLQQDLRRRMATEDCEKSASELVEEQNILVEIMKVVEKRDKLVSLLEEQRLKEKAEDRDLESLILSRGYQFHWT
ncbi:F-actin-monooxygenase mical2b isoform X7 [Danio rerio]|uniref:F-actin-monooxygenase mical2b isoform X7 n=2 Tax=Danio rerio TaxID=7955 RepID=A0AC58IVT9_DANRE|nr:[F-actin]-monooxygenase mical2b isoform 1 [Danio rerio]XP_005174399.1 protein-methionine sulfoxide oxidase mical2b isoform X7 [Danio rerio]AFS28883.1 microtubule associated monoxygenase calponin and LIM domain containing 2b isoform L [Danio rerio]|eukprot:NP_001258842.1 protein-methionine sulfoxide oxidase mical2b [Danio rerio]